MSLSKIACLATVLTSSLTTGLSTADACDRSNRQVTATQLTAVATSSVVVATSVSSVQPLPPGARIISSQILTAEEVAARTSPAKSSPETKKTNLPSGSATKPVEASKKTTVAKTQPAETRDVVDLQTEEEIEVDVRFAEEAVGSAILIAGEFETELEITQWSANAICLRMPTLGIIKPMNVRVAIYRPDGHLVRQFDARLIRHESIRRIARRPFDARLISRNVAVEVISADRP